MLVTSVAVLGLLLLALRCYAHARYPGKEALWLRVKTTHSTSYVPFRYLQADVRSKMVTELAANTLGVARDAWTSGESGSCLLSSSTLGGVARKV